jgi:hypothetical protein
LIARQLDPTVATKGYVLSMSANQNAILIRPWLKLADSGFSGDFEVYFTPDFVGQPDYIGHSSAAR